MFLENLLYEIELLYLPLAFSFHCLYGLYLSVSVIFKFFLSLLERFLLSFQFIILFDNLLTKILDKIVLLQFLRISLIGTIAVDCMMGLGDRISRDIETAKRVL